jgi:hypothetical protein
VSQAELVNLVDRIGNSIAAITKEVHLQRVGRPPQVDVPPAALIASVAGTETASGDPGAAAKPSG